MPEELDETAWVAHRTDAFLEAQARKESPFFLFSSFIRPHSPYKPLPRFARMYEDIDPDPFGSRDLGGIPPRMRELAEVKGWTGLNGETWNAIRTRYYALCTQVDEAVGRILVSLERHDLADNTVVVFTLDHGDFIGDHGLLGKGHPWESAIRVPCLIYDPGHPGEGFRLRDLFELVDIMPSVLELLDIAIPPGVQGRSVLSSLGEAVSYAGRTDRRVHRSVAISESVTMSIDDQVLRVLGSCVHPYILSVRGERYHYIHYAEEPGELYDLETDPDETVNLISDVSLAPVVSDLRRELLDWHIRTTGLQEPRDENSYFSTYFKHGGPDAYKFQAF